MSATAQTGNYHLPIYEAGNLANYMVDWNGAMNTIDAAMNVNHMDSDKLKTDFETIETEFQQVKTESSGAATAATQAQTDAARAITIANNATTVAGDAQVDAHAALTKVSELTTAEQLIRFSTNPDTIDFYLKITPICFQIYGFFYLNSNAPLKEYVTVSGNKWYAPDSWTPVPSNYMLNRMGVSLPKKGVYGAGDFTVVKKTGNNTPYEFIDASTMPLGLYRTEDDKYIPVFYKSNSPGEWEAAGGVNHIIFFDPLINPPRLQKSGTMLPTTVPTAYTLFL